MRIAFLGAGAWGTTLGIKLHSAGHEVYLWEINQDRLKQVTTKRKLPEILPDIRIPREIHYSQDIKEVVSNADLLTLAVPCQSLRSSLSKLPEGYRPPRLIVNLIKGLEDGSGKRPTGVWSDFFPDLPPVVLFGPSIAIEVLKGHPTALVAAGDNKDAVKKIQKLFSVGNLRVYRSRDPVGVELGGALKNVIAIGCGIAEGLGMGTNTRAALLARGLAEMTRLGEKMGADPRSFAGLTGWGDLVTTAWNPASRNHRVGTELARGRKLGDILTELGMVAEGVETCRITRKLGRRHKVQMPITEATYRILFQAAAPRDEIVNLLSRPLKKEVW